MSSEESNPKKASGRNISDDERNTDKLTIRVDPDDADTFRGIRHAWRCTGGELFSTMLAALLSNAAQIVAEEDDDDDWNKDVGFGDRPPFTISVFIPAEWFRPPRHLGGWIDLPQGFPSKEAAEAWWRRHHATIRRALLTPT